MSAWPSIAWTERRTAPPSRRGLAKERRSTGGVRRRRTPAAGAAPLGEPARGPRGGLAARRDEAMLASLARAHDVAGLELDVVQAEADALGGTHPGRVEQLEDGAVAHAARPARVGRPDARRGDLARQRAGQRPRPPRRVHVLRG